MKKILCYGDSNTFGFIPYQTCQQSEIRFEKKDRWTGILQQNLGDDYEIIEEGLGGRTTVFDDPPTQGRNGQKLLVPILQSHEPLDLIVLMLGTNDAKRIYNASVMEIGRGMEELVKICKNPYNYDSGVRPQILLISPIHLGEKIKESWLGDVFDEDSPNRIRGLAAVYQNIAEKYECGFLDAAMIVKPSEADSVHMDRAAHQKLAEAIEDIIRKMI
jgi:lysophospholipase L1-like esterase